MANLTLETVDNPNDPFSGKGAFNTGALGRLISKAFLPDPTLQTKLAELRLEDVKTQAYRKAQEAQAGLYTTKTRVETQNQNARMASGAAEGARNAGMYSTDYAPAPIDLNAPLTDTPISAGGASGPAPVRTKAELDADYAYRSAVARNLIATGAEDAAKAAGKARGDIFIERGGPGDARTGYGLADQSLAQGVLYGPGDAGTLRTQENIDEQAKAAGQIAVARAKGELGGGGVLAPSKMTEGDANRYVVDAMVALRSGKIPADKLEEVILRYAGAFQKAYEPKPVGSIDDAGQVRNKAFIPEVPAGYLTPDAFAAALRARGGGAPLTAPGAPGNMPVPVDVKPPPVTPAAPLVPANNMPAPVGEKPPPVTPAASVAAPAAPLPAAPAAAAPPVTPTPVPAPAPATPAGPAASAAQINVGLPSLPYARLETAPVTAPAQPKQTTATVPPPDAVDPVASKVAAAIVEPGTMAIQLPARGQYVPWARVEGRSMSTRIPGVGTYVTQMDQDPAGNQKPADDVTKRYGYLLRALPDMAVLDKYHAGQLPSRLRQAFIDASRTGISKTLLDSLRNDKEAHDYMAALGNVIVSIVRPDSGAAVSADEFRRYADYFGLDPLGSEVSYERAKGRRMLWAKGIRQSLTLANSPATYLDSLDSLIDGKVDLNFVPSEFTGAAKGGPNKSALKDKYLK